MNKLQQIMSDKANDPLTGEAGMDGAADENTPDDGTKLWLVDLIAPFGGRKSLLEDIMNTVLNYKLFNFHTILNRECV